MSGRQGLWRIERAERAALIVDAANYYRLVRKAMMAAREQILLIAWEFDTRISLDHGEPDDGAPVRLGAFLTWLADRRPGLCINILNWDVGALKLAWRGTTLLRLAQWRMKERIAFQADHVHPVGASHHQKIVVIDDSLAFCGGIDMTASRWDTRGHHDHDPGRLRPFTRRETMPWHDATMAVTGDAARALGDLGRERWKTASGSALVQPARRDDLWLDGVEPHFTNIDVGIARTRGQNGDTAEVREVEALFVEMIGAAQRFVYAETQYFASHVIGEAIVKRLAEPGGPEFVIINPKAAEGWLEEEVMGSARAVLLEAIRRRPGHERLRIYTPVTAGGDDIYVHAKIMIVDDRMLRVGSSNMNNRSMGLDTECDLLIDARSGPNARQAAAIAAIRNDLMAEHLGTTPGHVARAFAQTRSLIATVERLRGAGRSLRPFTPPELNAAEREMAESSALDPEGAADLFEPFAKGGLLQRLRKGPGGSRATLRR